MNSADDTAMDGLRECSGSAPGANDFELGLASDRLVHYHGVAPTSGSTGVAFVIPGFGRDDQANARALCKRLAERHGLLAVVVDYHCLHGNLLDGAEIELSDEEFASLTGLCLQHRVVLMNRSDVLTAMGQLPSPYEFEVRIKPPKGEYHNLGLMEALDHLSVLHRIKKQDGFAEGPVLAIGVGYGGYLAHLIAKIAPNSISSVFEHGAHIEPPSALVFGGSRENQHPYYYHVGKVRIAPLVRTLWETGRANGRQFSEAHKAMRHLANPAHVSTMRAVATGACAFHIDGLHPHVSYEEKRAQAELLKSAGYDVSESIDREATIEAAGDIGFSRLANLIDEHCPGLLRELRGSPSDFELGSSVGYACGDLMYGFEFGPWGSAANVTPLTRKRKSYRYY